jgi:hypothetical protein
MFFVDWLKPSLFFNLREQKWFECCTWILWWIIWLFRYQFIVMTQLFVFVTSSHLVGFDFVISHFQPGSTCCSYVYCHLISVDLQLCWNFRSLFKKEDVGGWCVPFPGSDRSVMLRSQRYFFEHEKVRPAQIQTYIIFKSLFAVIVVGIFGLVFLLLSKFRFGRKLLLKVSWHCFVQISSVEWWENWLPYLQYQPNLRYLLLEDS